ncbi:MAG: M23 family metallopeptidase [Ardenticatenaceae bacterium]
MTLRAPQRLLLCVLLLWLAPGWLAPAAPVFADGSSEETRPYLELPFAGESSFVVTCGYGCYQHQGSMSYAVDFAIPEGDPILAAAPGEVMAITWEVGLPVNLDLGDALILYIDHGQGWFTRYVHLSGITVRAGDHVEMGEIIGYAGKTGASGDHLHFELKYGSSLHSPSVPIDELFGGAEPVAGEGYASNNYREPRVRIAPTAAPSPTPPSLLAGVDVQPVSPPTSPQVGAGAEHRLPQVAGGLLLSAESVRVGEPVTATFTLRNTSRERLQLSLLGVAGRAPGDERTIEGSLFFDRSITLNPGRTYQFSRVHSFDKPGKLELFVFALGENNEWLPLGGASSVVPLTVKRSMQTLYLPTLSNTPFTQ